jgi:hypothetical protein
LRLTDLGGPVPTARGLHLSMRGAFAGQGALRTTTRPIFNVGPFDLVERRRRHQIFREPHMNERSSFGDSIQIPAAAASPQAATAPSTRRVRSRKQMTSKWRGAECGRVGSSQLSGLAHMHAESRPSSAPSVVRPQRDVRTKWRAHRGSRRWGHPDTVSARARQAWQQGGGRREGPASGAATAPHGANGWRWRRRAP